MVKKKKNKKRGLNKKEIKKLILEFCYDAPNKVFNYKQISAKYKIKDQDSSKLINVALQELTDDNYLEDVSRGKYKLKAKTGHVVGTLDMANKGYGFVVSEETEEDIFVAGPNINRALHGDKVRVYLHAKRKRKQPEGEIVEIIERAQTNFVGIVQMSKNYAFLVPTGKNHFDIFIPKEKLKGAKNGQKAVAKISEWPKRAKNPFGEIIDVLGEVGENNTEMHAILAEFDLPYKFTGRVEKAASRIPTEITAEEISKRRDFRKVPTLTIDPADAKDFDDALSFRHLENGNIEVGVHIADVSHYVQPDTIIDLEGYERGTSVYLVDRVVPMLPESLSNGVCSLRPNEDKLCFSAVFEMDINANVIDRWFGRTVIHSDKRFDYQEAQDIIENGKGVLQDEILSLHTLAQKLREKRFKEGAIDFERIEVKFHLDDKGRPTGIYFKEAKDSNQLVEEFMLLANKNVADFIGNKKQKSKAKTFVYRIHDRPDPEKLESFNSFISRFGYGINLNSPKNISTSLNNLLSNVKGSNEQNVIETLAIRSMAKAVYSTRNIGHYGLSFDFYTHFTSPIRRYPDLLVHRLLARYLESGRSADETKYEDMCKHASNREQRAVNAERTSIKYKQVEFMQDKVGQVFKGVISGVTDWGIFVEIEENKCEGMVPLRDLTDDFYFFDENNYCIQGMHTNRMYQLGAEIKIEVAGANLEKKQLDFKIADE